MKLKELLVALTDFQVFGEEDTEIKGIFDDSREVKKGGLFVAITGLTVDGHDYIPSAISKGARVVVGEKNPKKDWLKKITYVKAPSTRAAMGLIASNWYKNPSFKLKVIGVTGTDGKTTTSTLIWWILKTARKRVGLVTSVSAKIGLKEYDTGFHVTSPDPIPLQSFLAKMKRARCEYAVLEVTSHGLDQERVAGVKFDVGVLTNITHEHLDYHKTYENYLSTKAKLFKNVRRAILNREDESFERIKVLISNRVGILAYDLKTLDGTIREAVYEKFAQEYNRLNATAAILVAYEFGVMDKEIVAALKSFPGVPGRMEEVKNSKGFRIIVDFAHTPNALENVLVALRKELKTNARLIAVFGCAGERDVRKRSLMGEISTRLADTSVFTAEDPRSEKVGEIIKQMLSQTRKGSKVYKIPERGEAISFAIQKLAKKGDIVVICGKGHEKSMAYDGVEYPWSDQVAVKVALKGGVEKIKRK